MFIPHTVTARSQYPRAIPGPSYHIRCQNKKHPQLDTGLLVTALNLYNGKHREPINQAGARRVALLVFRYILFPFEVDDRTNFKHHYPSPTVVFVSGLTDPEGRGSSPAAPGFGASGQLKSSAPFVFEFAHLLIDA